MKAQYDVIHHLLVLPSLSTTQTNLLCRRGDGSTQSGRSTSAGAVYQQLNRATIKSKVVREAKV
jgi:hypothetical protein